jgi:hypothetical protein
MRVAQWGIEGIVWSSIRRHVLEKEYESARRPESGQPVYSKIGCDSLGTESVHGRARAPSRQTTRVAPN